MSRTIDYYLAPNSPWTYLGHTRFVELARAANATVRVLPMDLGKVFPVSGGLPLPKRSPQRQAYRLVELARFRDHLKLPLNLYPKYFPVAGNAAAQLIIAVDENDGWQQALRLTGAVLAAVWAQERNIADAAVLAELLTETGLPAQRLEQSASEPVLARYEQITQQAIDTGVFGAPTYVLDGELFWGQDRLDFLQHKLSA